MVCGRSVGLPSQILLGGFNGRRNGLGCPVVVRGQVGG